MKKETEYSKKLRDPRWQKKRLKILERDDFECQSCFSKENSLVVHHKKYAGEPWDADDESLITLCQFCHERCESTLKSVRELVVDHLFEFQMLCEFLRNDLDSHWYTTLQNYRNPSYRSLIETLNALLYAERLDAFHCGKKTEVERQQKQNES